MMKQGWEIKKLGEVCEILNGFAFDSSLFSDDSTHIPLIRIRDIKKGYTETFYKGSFSEDYIIKKGDYLIGMDGEFNIAEWSGINSLLNQRVCKLTVVDNKLLARYVLWFMPKALKKIEDETPFVTVKHLSSRKLLDISIPVPPLSEQERIVAELDLLSGIIEKQKQQLKEYDTLAQSIFYTMFGDPITNEKGWEVKSLQEVAPQQEYAGTVPCVNGKYWLLNLDMVASNTGEVIEKCYFDYDEIGNSTIVFNTDNVLYSKLRPYLNKVVVPEEIGYATSEMVPLLPQNGVLERVFFASLLRSKLFVEYISAKVAGAKMPRVAMSDFRNFAVILPPLTLQQEFAAKIEAIEKQKELVKQSLAEAETLFNSRMDYYFN